MDAINLGPLAIAPDRLLAVILLFGFVILIDRILARHGNDAAPATGIALIAGFVAARVAYVIANFDAFSHDWFAVIAVWQGGFVPWAGITAAAAVLAWRMRPHAAMVKAVVLLYLLGIAWYAGSALIRPEPRPLPDLPELIRMDGRLVTEAQLAGQPFVINLWATWCPPCRRELPMLAEIAATSDIPVLLINQGENSELVRNHLLANRISPAAVLRDPASSLTGTLQARGLPTTIFVDGAGNIVATHVGEISRAEMIRQLDRLKTE